MTCAVIAFTRRGAALGRRLTQALGGTLHVPPRLAKECAGESYTSMEDWTSENWNSAQALIFVGACGIAVRAIAPYVKDKFSDPAVVAVDEAGNFAISLLSGHVGGANVLARRIAAITGGQAVITTATDVNSLFAVDVWARERQLVISDRALAKAVSAALLEGKHVGFSSDFPVTGTLPAGLTEAPQLLNIRVTDRAVAQANTLALIPKVLTLGIGCRRGKTAAEIEEAVVRALNGVGLDRRAAESAASIDLKKDEPGLLEFCENWDLPFYTYSAGQLRQAPGEFHHSELVQQVTGVDNVCERAAVMAGGTLILPKQAANGVTVAVARKAITIEL